MNSEIAERAAREIESTCIDYDDGAIVFEIGRAKAIILRAIEESRDATRELREAVQKLISTLRIIMAWPGARVSKQLPIEIGPELEEVERVLAQGEKRVTEDSRP